MPNCSDFLHSISASLSSGATNAALREAVACVEQIFSQYHPSGHVSASFAPRAAMGVVCDRHLRLSIEVGRKHIAIPEHLVASSFSNALGSFRTIATLCETHPVRALPGGTTVIDIEDGSNQGDYERTAFCSALPQAALVVDDYYIRHRGYGSLKNEIDAAWVPWERREAKVFWRGSTTGIQGRIPQADAWHWRWLPRLYLCDVASRSHLRDRLDMGVINTVQINDPRAREAVVASGFMRPSAPRMDFLKYRYVMDIDGNANAWNGFFGALLMGSCVLKVRSPHGFRQWYYDRLIPGVHYLSINPDLSNLNDTVEWALAHPRECAEIGRRARNFAAAMSYEDEVDQSGLKLARLLTSPEVAAPVAP